jgi:hypothetical protein
MINNTMNNEDRVKVIDLLKRLGEEINHNTVLIDQANVITEQLLIIQNTAEIEGFEKQHVSFMEQLLQIFEKTQITKPFWPQLVDNQGKNIMLDLCVKVSNAFQRQYDDMRLHLYAVESKLGRYPKPPTPKELNNAGEALARATSDLTKSMLKLAKYYQISTLEW